MHKYNVNITQSSATSVYSHHLVIMHSGPNFPLPCYIGIHFSFYHVIQLHIYAFDMMYVLLECFA